MWEKQNTQADTNTNTQRQRQRQRHREIDKDTDTQTHTQTHRHTDTRTHRHRHTHTHAHTRAHTDTHTRTHTRTHTHTHTHTRTSTGAAANDAGESFHFQSGNRPCKERRRFVSVSWHRSPDPWSVAWALKMPKKRKEKKKKKKKDKPMRCTSQKHTLMSTALHCTASPPASCLLLVVWLRQALEASTLCCLAATVLLHA